MPRELPVTQATLPSNRFTMAPLPDRRGLARPRPGPTAPHERIRGPQRTHRDLLPLVRGLALLGAQEDRRIGVGPQIWLALFQALVFQVARPVPAEPRFLVEDEAAGPDAHEIRREDAFQERDVA